ncbi:MAG: BamA/TamA family outer membrane protein, partial [Spirochaetes bacterium]|nr:BamA/TamA family outer membrane protein [Spirochaetota bacterium]
PAPPLPRGEQNYWISDVYIQGLQRVSKGLVMSKMGLSIPSTVSSDELGEAIADLYGSNFFESVVFRIIPTDMGNMLMLEAEEKRTNLLRFGISYDTSLKSAIFVNLTFRNLVGMGSYLSISGRLSEYPGFDTSYFLFTGWRPGIGFGIDAQINMYNVVSYPNANSTEDVKSSYDLTIYYARLFVQTIWSTMFAMGLGIEKEYNMVRPDLGSSYITKTDTESLNYYIYLKFDSMDRYYFPRSGLQINLQASMITDNLPIRYRERYATFRKISVSILAMIPFHRRVSLMLSLQGGTIIGHDIPYGYLFYMGGLYTFSRDFFSFPGINFLEMSGKNASVYQAGIQVELWKNIIIMPRASAGRTEDQFRELFVDSDFVYAYGLTLAYNSLIGPLEVTGMYGGMEMGFTAYVNIGFRY